MTDFAVRRCFVGLLAAASHRALGALLLLLYAISD